MDKANEKSAADKAFDNPHHGHGDEDIGNASPSAASVEVREVSFEEFSAAVLRYESKVDAPRVAINEQMLCDTLKIFATAAAQLDILKKAIFYGKPIDETRFLFLRELIIVTADRIGDEYRHGADHPAPSPIALGVPCLSGVDDPALNMRMLHALLGACTEAGELGEALCTAIDVHEPLDFTNVNEEFGDFDWYKAVWCDATSTPAGMILARVANKLAIRYKDKYSDQGALNRNLVEERKRLEGE